MDRAFVQQVINGVPVTEFNGVQNPTLGSNPIEPTEGHILAVITKLLDPNEEKSLIRIAQHTPNREGMTMSTKQVKLIKQMLDSHIANYQNGEG